MELPRIADFDGFLFSYIVRTGWKRVPQEKALSLNAGLKDN
jgi:hypothetical protein